MKNKINFYASPFPRIKSYKQMIDLSVEYDLFAVECLNMYEFSTPDVEISKQLREYADNKGVHFPCISLFIDLTSEDSAVQIETAKKYAVEHSAKLMVFTFSGNLRAVLTSWVWQLSGDG